MLLPIIQQLLRDESSDVRLNVIGELGKVSDTLGFKELSRHILPAVTALATDSKWRVREGVINVVPSLAKLMGPQTFNTDLSKIAVGWLTDQVCEIRTLVAQVLCDLWGVFGEDWARTSLLPKVRVLASKDNYMHRVALLNFLRCVAKSQKCSAELLNTSFLPIFRTMAQDKVPNVRFNVAKSVEVCATLSCSRRIVLSTHRFSQPLLHTQACLPKLERQAIAGTWRPLLDDLERDADHDVKHYARKVAYHHPLPPSRPLAPLDTHTHTHTHHRL